MDRRSWQRFGRLLKRGAGAPSERDWERSALLEPRLTLVHPELVSDGGGLAFAPSALAGVSGQLDPTDPAVDALVAQMTRSASPAAPRAVEKESATLAPALPSLDGWRLLAHGEDEVLFGRGYPPDLTTVTVRHDGRRGTWKCVEVSRARPLRATREGIRASAWRLDPTYEADLGRDTVVRVLVTEQTWAGAKRADGRLLPPDLYVDGERFVLTMFVTPRPGFQVRSPNPETPARIALPYPVDSRRLIDGALYDGASAP